MLGEPLPNYRLRHVVANQSATGYDAAHLRTELGVVLHVPPQDVADADVFQIEILSKQLGLRALSAALDPHDHELAHGRPLT
jgi:hypothetical protein